MTRTPMTGAPTRHRHPVQLASLVVGLVFLLVGILGFIPGITTNYDQLTFWGPGSMAMLLGLFNVSILHNIVHLLFGLGILAARTPGGAKKFLIGSGLVYAVLTVYGFLVPHDTMANFPPVNVADNWLYLGLAVGLLALGRRLRSTASTAPTTCSPQARPAPPLPPSVPAGVSPPSSVTPPPTWPPTDDRP